MRTLTLTLTATAAAAALTIPLTASTANAATRHHQLITGPAGASGYPSWVYDNNPQPSKAALAINVTVYSTANDRLREIHGTTLCLQRQSTRGGTWHKLTCKTSSTHGDVRFIIASAPHSGWYYRVHHYTSTYYYAATSWRIHPVY